jgi:hypothetical protein
MNPTGEAPPPFELEPSGIVITSPGSGDVASVAAVREAVHDTGATAPSARRTGAAVSAASVENISASGWRGTAEAITLAASCCHTRGMSQQVLKLLVANENRNVFSFGWRI